MNSISKIAGKLELTSYEDIFETDDQKSDVILEKIMEVPLIDLHSFENHPFKVIDDEAMQEMVGSISKNGILLPGVVRTRKNGGYELIAGHRRKHACQLTGLETMPVIIRELNDDESILAMVDSNLQREALLFSEKAFAYKMKSDAIKRQAGRPSQNNGSQFGANSSLASDASNNESSLIGKKSYEIIGESCGESKNQVYRYIRLTELLRELLEMVDEKKIGFSPAVELSYLKKEEQKMLLNMIEKEEVTPSLSQAQRMKKHSQEDTLTQEVIEEILREVKKEPTKVTFTRDRLKKYFTGYVTPKAMEETIIKALELFFSTNRQEGQTVEVFCEDQ